jgi:hypothetical protein
LNIVAVKALVRLAVCSPETAAAREAPAPGLPTATTGAAATAAAATVAAEREEGLVAGSVAAATAGEAATVAAATGQRTRWQAWWPRRQRAAASDGGDGGDRPKTVTLRMLESVICCTVTDRGYVSGNQLNNHNYRTLLRGRES